MKQKHNEGFSLVEVLVAMAILATILIGTGSALTTSYRINNKTDELMQAQLVVSSKVEKLMAEGIYQERISSYSNDKVDVTVTDQGTYCTVVVKSKIVESVSVTTSIRKVGAWS